MTDLLSARAAREYREERDRQERAKAGPRLAVDNPHPPPPQSEDDYGVVADSPIGDEGVPPPAFKRIINPADWEGSRR